MYNNSQLDIVNLANMFGIRIATFTYNINDHPPRWTWHSPHQYITSYSQHRNVEGPDMWLFHEDDCHYDLLVPREVVQPIVEQVPATHPEPVQHLVQPINLSSAEEVEFSVDSDSLPTPPPPQRLIMESCK